jgi:hypothetical protein
METVQQQSNTHRASDLESFNTERSSELAASRAAADAFSRAAQEATQRALSHDSEAFLRANQQTSAQ